MRRDRVRAQRNPAERDELRLGLLFVLPAFLIYVVFLVAPLLTSIYYSLTDWNGASSTKRFVGLDNYRAMLADRRLFDAVQNNLVFVVIGTALTVGIGLVLAVLLWSTARFGTFYRLLLFIPFTLPVVIVGVVWSWIYNPLFGSLNAGLEKVGLESLQRGWLGESQTALPALVGAQTWGLIGFVVVVLFAALQNVDQSLIEAAMLDGARWRHRLRYIILPQIAPVMTMVTALMLTYGFQVFDIIFVTTNGGPGTSTEVLGTYAYRAAFANNEVGYGSGLSLVLTVFSVVLAVAFVRFRERRHRT